jgi:hypothetical protein
VGAVINSIGGGAKLSAITPSLPVPYEDLRPAILKVGLGTE